MPLIAGSPQPGALSYAANDLGIVWAVNDNGPTPSLADTGWTSLGADSWAAGRAYKWWKVLSAGGLPDPFVVNLSATRLAMIGLLIIRGAHLTAPIGGSPYANSVDALTVAPCPALTTGGPNRLILRAWQARQGNWTDNTGYGTGVTGLFLQGTNGGPSNCTLGIAWENELGAGVNVGTHTFAPTGGTIDHNGAETIEVIPA